MQFFSTSTTGNTITCLHGWTWEHDNITIANMHLKDYLERHEEFRSLVHLGLHEKKLLKVDWGESLQMDLKFLEVYKNEEPSFYLEVVVWEALQKLPFLFHIKQCWKLYFGGLKFSRQDETAFVVQKKTVCILQVRSLLGPTLYRVWYNTEAQTNNVKTSEF